MIKQVIEMWHAGFSIKKIAEKFEVSTRTIEQILIQQGEYY